MIIYLKKLKKKKMTQVEFAYLIEFLEKTHSREGLRIIYEIDELESKNLSVSVALLAVRTGKSVSNISNYVRSLKEEKHIIFIRKITCQNCFNEYKGRFPQRCECGAKLLNLEKDLEKKSQYPRFLIQLAEETRNKLRNNYKF